MNPEPTEYDREREASRQAIAAVQNAAWAECLKLALGALGPGWEPWMKLSLVDSDHRRNGQTEVVAVGYKVRKEGQQAMYLRKLPDGQVLKADNYQAVFGTLLEEKHPTYTVEVRGQQVAVHRWEMHWSYMEWYQPKSAEELAALRVSREAGKEKRLDKKFAQDNPLFVLAGITRQDLENDTDA